MLRLLAVLAVCGALQLTTGCRHTGGECDCGPVPGDSVGVNPHLPGYNAHTGTGGYEQIAPAKTAPAR